MDYYEAMDIIGGLSNTSKMPWYSWSTSAEKCITGSKLREVKGSVCADCYACKGCYVFKSVKEAHQRKFEALNHPKFVEAFILVLNKLYERGRKTYNLNGVQVKENRFRWHDSGDIQSVEHMNMICDIAEGCPQIDFWIPTREYGIMNKFLKTGRKIPDNLTVRMSVVMVGETVDERPMGLPFSTVGVMSAKAQCPAYEQEGKCLDCRVCWDKEENTNYPLH